MSDDIRVLLVKLADRLHNMRTLHFIKSPEKRRRIARETMDIYAPLAERIGLYGFMDELQALAFQQLEPEGYDTVVKRLEAMRAAGGGDMVAQISGSIRDLLAGAGIEAEVRGREKRPYSIWRKMQAHRIAFENLPDVIAFRVVVANPAACYRALGVIHQRWQVVLGRFKDFISTPKPNGYRSLHTTVIHGDDAHRDPDPHARDGPRGRVRAGRALGLQGERRRGRAGARGYPWLKDLLDAVDQATSPEEVLEHTRLAMFQDQVFAFTPKGELIQLPDGACPVDFAYAVHTELGDTCVGAKVNGRVVPLRTPLANGDQVEILRSKAQQPDPAWEKFVVSVKARSAVRRFVRQQERAQLLSLGRKLYDETVGRLKLPLSEDAVDAALGRLKLADRNALYLALARQTVGDTALLEAVLPGSTANLKPRRRGRAGPKGDDLDHRPDAGRRLSPRRMLPPDPRRPHRRRRAGGPRHRGPQHRLRAARRAREATRGAANGSTSTGATRPRPASPASRGRPQPAGQPRRADRDPRAPRGQHRQLEPDRPRPRIPHLRRRHRGRRPGASDQHHRRAAGDARRW